MFHPDKHPDRKETAERLFQRLQTAYTGIITSEACLLVLSDERVRAVYDEHGWLGLEAYWQLAPHHDANLDEVILIEIIE